MRLTEDQYMALADYQCEHELFSQIASLSRILGFGYCAYAIHLPLPISRPHICVFHNYHSDKEMPDFLDDASLKEILAERVTVHSYLSANNHHNLFDISPDTWRSMRIHADLFYLADFQQDWNGTRILLLASEDHDIIKNRAETQQAQIRKFADSCHQSMSKLIVARLIPEAFAKITEKEKEVLIWTAEGKTSSEIAMILGIKKRTVDFHLSNAVKKLSASNKLQGAVKAASLGLLR